MLLPNMLRVASIRRRGHSKLDSHSHPNHMGATIAYTTTPIHYMQHTSPVTCEKHISDVEAIGHDHVDETMGYK